MNSKETIGILQFGCAKNLIDTELMLGILKKNGYSYSLNPYDENIKTVIINTCSFILDAEKESISAIMEMIQLKKRIILTGCLVQKHKEELVKNLPEVENYIGTTTYDKIIEAIENQKYYNVESNPDYCYREDIEREQITMGSSSYIKIADGCMYNCGYCVIPNLRGKYKSRKMENIVAEARKLAKKGVSEVILIAQDTSSYGIDIYKKPMLAELLSELNKIEELSWIRVMYLYPNNIDKKLLTAFRKLKKVVKYIDIPLQHSNPEVLKRMKRPVIDYKKLIRKIRKEIPNVAIRTTFITGYPGETQEEYNDLVRFVKEMKFDKAGVFAYSKEENTYAATLEPQVTNAIKSRRKNNLLKIQKAISLEKNKALIGSEVDCIIEQIDQDGKIIARTYKDAPEVDGVIYLKSDECVLPGDVVTATVTRASHYDLWGKIEQIENEEIEKMTKEKPAVAINTSLAILPISSVAQALNVHQRTLRIYDKEGILSPSRSDKNRRNYSLDDLERAKAVLYLTRNLSINLAGVKTIMAMFEVLDIEPANFMEYLEKSAKKAKITLAEQRENLKKYKEKTK